MVALQIQLKVTANYSEEYRASSAALSMTSMSWILDFFDFGTPERGKGHSPTHPLVFSQPDV
jgi:hypothetical protein